MRKEYSSLIRAGEYKKFYKTRIRVLKDIIPRFSTFYENLKYLRIPILLIAGEEDHVVPIFKVSGYLSGGFPRAITFFPSLERNHINLSVKMIKNCGHMPIIEHPDIVNKYIDRFISK
jgi:pimeloyl-ACP methyl ester carboxylesterase